VASVQLPAEWGLWLFFPNFALFCVYIFFLVLMEKDIWRRLGKALD